MNARLLRPLAAATAAALPTIASAQAVLGPWTLASPPAVLAGSVLACLGNGFGMAFGPCVLLKAIAHVEEGAVLSNCFHIVTATAVLTVGPLPTVVEFTGDLNGQFTVEDADPPGPPPPVTEAVVGAIASLNGVPILLCNPVPNFLNVVGVVPVANACAVTLCLLPGVYTVEAQLSVAATTSAGFGFDDAISDFNTGARGFMVCVNPLGPWWEPCLPPGYWITSHFQSASAGLQTPGGLWLHHPTGLVPSYEIQGLSNELTGLGAPTGTGVGANCVAISDAWQGSAYVGEVTAPAAGPGLDTLELREIIWITPGTVAQDLAVAHFGTVSAAAQITGIALVPGAGRDAVVTLSGHTYGGSDVVYYQAGPQPGVPGAALPIPVSYPVTGAPNAVAVDPTGQTIWLGLFQSLTQSTIVAVPIGGGPAQFVAQVPAGISGLVFDESSGRIYASCLGGPPNLFAVDPGSGAVLTIPTATGTLNGVAFEAASGTLAVVGGAAGLPPAGVHRIEVTGASTLLASAPPAGWGSTSGIAVSPNPRTFGNGFSSSFFGVAWQIPWSGALQPLDGLCTAGNANFGVSLRSTPPTLLVGVIAVAAARLDPGLPFPGGGTVHVDLAQLITTLPVVTTTGDWALPIPLPPGIPGLELYMQGAFLTATGGWVLTPGLHCRTH